MRVPTNKGLVRIFGRFYIVQFGDSLFSISQRFGVSIVDILTFNDQISGASVIFPGEMLFIPKSFNLSKKSRRRTKKSKKKK